MNIFRVVLFSMIFFIVNSSARSATITASTQPTTTAETFLKDLETMLSLEAKGEKKQADDLKNRLAEMISDETVNSEAAPYGKSIANLSPEALLSIQKGMVTAWAAVINYYRGSLDYSGSETLIPLIHVEEKDTVTIAIPVRNLKNVYPVKIVVVCVQEKGQWKIKFTGIMPIRPSSRIQTTSRPVTPAATHK